MIKNDCLDFWKKSRNYIENYLFHYWNNWWELNSWMNFITGLWWSWKTTFINEVIDNLNDNWDEKYLNGRKLITIKFNPWDYQNTKNIYEQFLTSLSCSLLKYKYDDNIKSDSKDLIKLLDSKYVNFFDWIRRLIYSNNDSIEDLIIKINKSIQTTYKDFLILIVVDEIDRLEKVDLVNVWKVLNLIKRLITENQNSNLRKNILCIYSADSYHLSNFYLWDKQDEEWITFFQYFKKFPDTKFDIYQNCTNDIIKQLAAITADRSNFDYKYDETIINKSKLLFNELNSIWIPICIRDLDFLNKDLSQNIDNISSILYKNFQNSMYKWLIERWFIWQIVREKLGNGDDLKLDFIYLSSIYEKDSEIINKLSSIYSWMKYYWSEERKNLIKNSRDLSYKFNYRFDNEYTEKKLLDFIETDYPLLLRIFDKNDLWWWYNYIIKKLLQDIWDEISYKELSDIYNYNEIAKILFKPNINQNENIFVFTRSNFLSMWIECKDSFNKEQNIKFFENSIEVFKGYIDSIYTENWGDICNNDYWFILSAFFFIYSFVENLKTIGVIKQERDSLNIEDKTTYKEIQNILISFLNFLIDGFHEENELSFIKIFIFIRLIRYSQYREKWDSNHMFLLLTECLQKCRFIKKTDNITNLFDYIEKKCELYFSKFDNVIKPIEDFLIKMNLSDRRDREWEILNFLELIIYSLYDWDPSRGDANIETEKIYNFLVNYVKDEKYQFLFLCYSQKLWYDYKLYTEQKFIDSSSRIWVYKKLYKNFSVNDKSIWKLVKKYFYDIWLIMLENHTWMPKNLWKNYKHLVDDADSIIKCISEWLKIYK